MSASRSSRPDPAAEGAGVDKNAFPLLPTETEIYILPDGRVIVADLPVELTPLAGALGSESREAPPRP